jgi:phage terminase large subunit-like protein
MHNSVASFPERIWNMDEMGLNVAHMPRQVIATKGAKSIHGKTYRAKETVTVIAFIMPGKSKKKLHGYDTQSVGKGSPIAWANFSVSESG